LFHYEYFGFFQQFFGRDFFKFPPQPTKFPTKYRYNWRFWTIFGDVFLIQNYDIFSRKLTSDEDLEGEEDFYYTELEVPLYSSMVPNDFTLILGHASLRPNNKQLFSTSAPPSVLRTLTSYPSDHMDMARPPHENPEYNFAQQQRGDHASNFGMNQQPRPSPAHHQPRMPVQLTYPPPPPPPPPAVSSMPAGSSMSAAVPIAIPVTNFAFASSAVRNLYYTILLGENIAIWRRRGVLFFCISLFDSSSLKAKETMKHQLKLQLK
jgi:hypothetical protein